MIYPDDKDQWQRIVAEFGLPNDAPHCILVSAKIVLERIKLSEPNENELDLRVATTVRHEVEHTQQQHATTGQEWLGNERAALKAERRFLYLASKWFDVSPATRDAFIAETRYSLKDYITTAKKWRPN